MNLDKHYISTFYLVKRDTVNTKTSDPLLKYYEWWIVYYHIPITSFDERISRIVYSREEFVKDVLSFVLTELSLPVRSPKYYVELAKELGFKVEQQERMIKLPTGEYIQVQIPIIFFGLIERYSDSPNLCRHILFTAVLGTYENPDEKWMEARKICMFERTFDISVIMSFATTSVGRYDRYKFSGNVENYLDQGIEEVLRVGKGYRALHGYF